MQWFHFSKYYLLALTQNLDWKSPLVLPEARSKPVDSLPFIWTSKHNHGPTLSSDNRWLDSEKKKGMKGFLAEGQALQNTYVRYLHGRGVNTPCGANLFCSWWNVDQMAYIPPPSPTWNFGEPPFPPPAACTVSEGHSNTLPVKSKSAKKGKLAQPCAFLGFTLTKPSRADQNGRLTLEAFVPRTGWKRIWNVWCHHSPVLNRSQETPGRMEKNLTKTTVRALKCWNCQRSKCLVDF